MFECHNSFSWYILFGKQIQFLIYLNFLFYYSGVSSFNQFIHELSVDSDTSSSLDYSSGEDSDGNTHPTSPLSHSSRVSRANSFTKPDRRRTHWIGWIFSWILVPINFLLGIPLYLYRSSFCRQSRVPTNAESFQPSILRSPRRSHGLKDHFIQRTTDRRRGVIEVCSDILPILL